MMMDTTLVKHLVISEQTVFTVYVFLWAISAVVFYLLGKRAKNIEAKKRLDTIFFIIIALLMLLVGLLAHFPAVALIFLGMALVGFYFLSCTMTFYCPFCGNRIVKQPFSNYNHCPNCGMLL